MDHKIITLPLRLAIIVLIFGALFKVMHWSYATQLMLIGGVSIGLLYTIRFFYKKEKSKLDYVKLALVLLWVFSYLVKAFHLIYIPYVLEIILIILFVWWFIEEGIYYFKNRSYKNNRFLKVLYYLLIGLTISALFLGIIFKISHWPYGTLLLTIGVLMLNILLIFDYFLVERKEI